MKRPKLSKRSKDSRTSRLTLKEWDDWCEERDVWNCVLPEKKFCDLLELNVNFLTEHLPEIVVGENWRRRPERIRHLMLTVHKALRYFVKYYLESSLPYREKCRMLQRLDKATDAIYRNPTINSVCTQMILFNWFLEDKKYSDRLVRNGGLPLNYVPKVGLFYWS